MRVAIVHDWFDTPGGAEYVIKELLSLYPDADLYALVDFFSERDRWHYLGGRSVRTTWIQRLPSARRRFRYYLPLFPLAIESLDLRVYDLIISSSHAVAKGVLTGPEQKHLCYIYTPMRYAWDMYHDYMEGHRVGGFRRWYVGRTLHRIRQWDLLASFRPDRMIAISSLIRRRVEKYYRRDAELIHPPVDTERFTPDLSVEREEFYLTASRLVPYKKVDMIIEAFRRSQRRLVVVGAGEEFGRLKEKAPANVEMLGYCEEGRLVDLMRRARAFVYGAYEDFGIVPVEAMACGTPVVALGRGGTAETVLDGVTGVHFAEQTPESLLEALERFESIRFDLSEIRRHAERFSAERFRREFSQSVECLMGSGQDAVTGEDYRSLTR